MIMAAVRVSAQGLRRGSEGGQGPTRLADAAGAIARPRTLLLFPLAANDYRLAVINGRAGGPESREAMMQALSKLVAAEAVTIAFVALAHPAIAQTVGEGPAAKTGTRIITLGTRSGPNPTVGRAQSSNLLVVNGTRYLIDAGEGVTRRLTRFGSNFCDIEMIFITHPHSDHTGGLGGLMGTIYDANRVKPVAIVGPPGTDASVKGLLQFLNVSSEIRISDGGKVTPVAQVFTSKDLGIGEVLKDANVKVTAAENSHFNFPPGTPGYGKYKSYSYRFDAPDRSIVFTGDTGPSDAVVTLAKGADVFVSEVNSVDDYKER